MAIRRFGNSSITSAGGKSSKFWDQETSLGTFESIASATVDSNLSSGITFSNIPQNYTHLQLRYMVRVNNASSNFADVLATFNADSGSNYSQYHQFFATQGSYYSNGNNTATTSMAFLTVNAVNTDANVFTGGYTDILDYTSTSKKKTVRSIHGYSSSTTAYYHVLLRSNMWNSTSPITSIEITPTGSLTQYSQFSLYGIRGA